MCWEYEDKYENCFDNIFYGDDWSETEEGLYVLLRNWNVIVDKEKRIDFELKFYDFLTDCHEKGIIRPQTVEEREAFCESEWNKRKKEIDLREGV
jgi:hypothetical protein